MGEGIAESLLYPIWLITDIIQQATGGIPLPNVAVMGNEVNLSAFTVEGIVKGGLVGLSTLAMIPSIISSVTRGGGLSSNIWGDWNASQMTQRGGGITPSSLGVTTGTSESAYVGSSASSDMKQTSVQGAMEESEDVKEITSAGTEELKNVDDVWKSLFDEAQRTPVRVVVTTASGASPIEKLAEDIDYDNAINVNVINSVLKTSSNVSDISNEALGLIKQLLLNTLYGGTNGSKSHYAQGEDSDELLKKVLSKLLNDTIDVSIKNDNFDEYITKQLYQNL